MRRRRTFSLNIEVDSKPTPVRDFDRSIVSSMTNSAASDDMNVMLLFLLEFAEQMLRETGTFWPFGSGLTPDRNMTGVAYDDAERPTAQDVLATLHSALAAQAAAGTINVTGICLDVRVTPPGASAPCDAICVELQHREGQALDVFVPYELPGGGEVQFGQSFTAPGEQTMFLPIAG
jgi:hypothetical protein